MTSMQTQQRVYVMALLLMAQPVRAQGIGAALVQTVTDATTYAPAALLYVSERGDWESSQTLFAHGAVENGARWTLDGRAGSTPMSDGAGRTQIAHDTLRFALVSAANNLSVHLLANALAKRHPEQKQRIKALALVERVGVASVLSMVLSTRHFEQWRANVTTAHQLGY